MNDELKDATAKFFDRQFVCRGDSVCCSATPDQVRRLRELCGVKPRDDMWLPKPQGDAK